MARLARVVVPGCPHHLTQRGNRRQEVFFGDADRRRYLALLGEQCQATGLRVWAYCLMTNHVHLVVVPPASDTLGRVMQALNARYTAWVNRRQGFCGHLWQGRFYSTPLDESHLWSALRYVERNPVRAGLVSGAWDYRWSSAPGRCGFRADSLLSALPESIGIADASNWRAFLSDMDDAADGLLRRRTHTGRPCGDVNFIERLETVLGRSLRPAKRGPKTKRLDKEEAQRQFSALSP